jgi:hypothetical protein
MSNHNSDPGIPDPEIQFSDQDVRYLEDHTAALQRASYMYNDDTELFQESVERTVDNGVNGAISLGEAQNYGLTLVVVTEALGATKNQYKLSGLLDLLNQNPLIDAEDRVILNDVMHNAEAVRNNQISEQLSEEEVASAIAYQIAPTLSDVCRMETQGKNKGALIVALLGFSTGATLKLPLLQSAEQLMQEVHKHQEAS